MAHTVLMPRHSKIFEAVHLRHLKLLGQGPGFRQCNIILYCASWPRLQGGLAGHFPVTDLEMLPYMNVIATISGFVSMRIGGPHVPAPLEV